MLIMHQKRSKCSKKQLGIMSLSLLTHSIGTHLLTIFSINYTASSALINLATLENTLNNHERSLELHQLAVDVLNTTTYRQDHYASLLYNYGLLLHSLDRVSEAEKHWEYAMEMGNYLAIANLATLMSVNGTTLTINDAQSMYKQSMDIALENKDYHNYWYYALNKSLTHSRTHSLTHSLPAVGV